MESKHRTARGHAPRSSRRFRIAAAALLVLMFAAIAASCDSNSSKSESESTSTTAAAEQAAATFVGAEQAIADYVESLGHEYVGDCANAELPGDKGKWCSTLVSGDDASGAKTYAIGPVGEDPEKEITVTRRGSEQLTPGFQVGVAEGNVGDPQQLTGEQIEADAFITDNLVLDQQNGIGNGLADRPAGVTTPGAGTGGTGGGTGGGGTGTPPIVVTPPTPAPGAYPATGIIIVVDPNIEAGGEAVFTGGGCLPNELLSVSFDGQPAGTITADGQGDFAGSLKVPVGTAPGVHLVTVQGAFCVLNANVTVQGALAFTGSSSHTTTYVLVGFAAVVVGLVLVVGTRRRRRGVAGRSFPPPSSA